MFSDNLGSFCIIHFKYKFLEFKRQQDNGDKKGQSDGSVSAVIF